jgi:hypothetical protein
LDTAGSVEFLARFLNSRTDGISEQAALAFGESRLPAAFDLLREVWERGAVAEQRGALPLAIAMLRIDEALEFLLTRLGEESGQWQPMRSRGWRSARAMKQCWRRVDEIVRQRGDGALEAVFAREFARA